jgi:hypothetical protein
MTCILFVSRAAALAGCTLIAFAGASAAKSVSVVYTTIDTSIAYPYLVDWRSAAHRAHVVELIVEGDGSYIDDGTQRVVTFDGAGMPPYLVETTDCNGDPMQQSVEITQTVFRPTTGTLHKGTSATVDIGYTTDIGGCTPGKQTPFGTLDDAGTPMNNLDMDRRASMADLVPGAQLAGPTEEPMGQGPIFLLAGDITTIGKRTIAFQRTGHQFPTTRVDGWLVIELDGYSRAYTRVTQDPKTGVETWLVSDWVDGAPVDVERVALIVVTSPAGFGGLSKAAHVWNEGLFMNSPQPLAYYLYRDLSGLRVFDGDIANGQPVTWSQPDGNLQIIRPLDDIDYEVRTWQPLANRGKYHFVMESEDLYDETGYVGSTVPARVNWYVDEGKAVKHSVLQPLQLEATRPPVQ